MTETLGRGLAALATIAGMRLTIRIVVLLALLAVLAAYPWRLFPAAWEQLRMQMATEEVEVSPAQWPLPTKTPTGP